MCRRRRSAPITLLRPSWPNKSRTGPTPTCSFGGLKMGRLSRGQSARRKAAGPARQPAGDRRAIGFQNRTGKARRPAFRRSAAHRPGRSGRRAGRHLCQAGLDQAGNLGETQAQGRPGRGRPSRTDLRGNGRGGSGNRLRHRRRRQQESPRRRRGPRQFDRAGCAIRWCSSRHEPRNPSAEALYEYLGSPEATKVFERHGFMVLIDGKGKL